MLGYLHLLIPQKILNKFPKLVVSMNGGSIIIDSIQLGLNLGSVSILSIPCVESE